MKETICGMIEKASADELKIILAFIKRLLKSKNERAI